MSDMDRPLTYSLTPAETARRFGVTVKALRVYEARGLLTPLRKGAGATRAQWRTYGPQQLARLHQILALKRLGLSLARIGEILAGPDTLAAVLALQADALARDREKLSQALVLVQKAQAKLAGGQALSIDDLANLTKETVMTKPNVKELGTMLAPFGDQHFSPQERQALKAGIDRDQFVKDVNSLMAEALALIQAGEEPAAPAAQDFARRWLPTFRQIRQAMTAGGPGIKDKSQAVWNDALNDPGTAEKLALHRQIFAFVDQALAHLKAQEK
jgi:DNA-binding transcriptional MerR regulator